MMMKAKCVFLLSIMNLNVMPSEGNEMNESIYLIKLKVNLKYYHEGKNISYYTYLLSFPTVETVASVVVVAVSA